MATTTALVAPTIDSPFGKPIPIIVGKATVECIPLYTGNFVANTTGGTYAGTVDFAVMIGRADPLAAKTIISKLYADGVLFFDASGKTAITLPGHGAVRIYTGTEDQLPDPMLVEVYGDLTPAFRGLAYVVFQGYPLPAGTTSQNLPQILAEMSQTNDPSALVQPMAVGQYGYPRLIYFDTDQNQLVYVGYAGLDVYSIDSATAILSLPMVDETGVAYTMDDAADVPCCKSQDDTHYYAIITPAGPGYKLARINRQTNAVEASIVLSNPFGSIWTMKGAGQWDEYIIRSFSNELYGRKGNVITFVKNLPVLPSNIAFFAAAPTLANIATWQKWSYIAPNTQGLVQRSGGKTYDYTILENITYSLSPLGPAVRDWLGTSYLLNEYMNGRFVPTTGIINGYNEFWTLSGPTQASRTLIGDANTDALSDNLFTSPALLATMQTAFTLPTQVCDPVDTSAFSVAYCVASGKVYRIVLCDDTDVVFMRRPSNIPPAPVIAVSNPATFTGAVARRGTVVGSAGGSNATDNAPDTPADAPLANVNSGATLQVSTKASGNPPFEARTGGDLVTQMADVSGKPGTLVGIFAGPPDDPFVSLLYSGVATGQLTVLAFDTFWNRRPSTAIGSYQSAYYYYKYTDRTISVEGTGPGAQNLVTITPNPLYRWQPPMDASVRDYFAPLTARNAPGEYKPSDNPRPLKIAQWQGTSRYASWATGGVAYNVDMRTGAYTSFGDGIGFKNASTGVVVPDSPFEPKTTIDAEDGIIYGYGTYPYYVYVNGGASIGDVTLDQVLRSLAVQSGYDIGIIASSGLTSIDVQGAVINTTVTFAQLLEALSTTFRFDVFDTNGKINFVRKLKNNTFAYDGTIYESDLVSLEDGGISGNAQTVKFTRAFASDLPGILTLEYIDQDFLGTVGTQQAKRTVFPYKTINGVQTQDQQVPVVMSANDAAYWANVALYDIWASATEVDFRLPQDGLIYDPGDYIELVMNNGDIVGVHITGTTRNGDNSVSVKGVTLSQYDSFTAPSGAPTYATDQSITKLVPPVFLCPDNVLVYPADAVGIDAAPYRWTANAPASLYIYNGKTYTFSTTEVSAAVYGFVTTKLAALPANWCPAYDDKASVTYVPAGTNKAPDAAGSVAACITGTFVAFVGAPGRWEMIFYNRVVQNPNGSVTLSGLVRGRRGTDVVASQHQPGDVLFVPPLDWPLIAFAANGGTGNVKTLPRGASAGTTGANSTVPGLGAPLLPWAPVQVRAVASGADIVLTWLRRTRSADELHDVDASVTLETGTEGYAIGVLTAGQGGRVGKYSSTAPTFTYTAAMQAVDGYTSIPASLSVSIAQIDPALGTGTPRSVTINVGA